MGAGAASRRARRRGLLRQQHRLDPPMGCVTDVQARHLIGRMLQQPAERIDVAHILRHGYLSGGMDTVEMDETSGPLHKGFVFARFCSSSSSTRRESASDR